MENNLNNQNSFNFMNRLILSFFAMLLIMTSGFSAVLIDSINNEVEFKELQDQEFKEVNNYLYLTFTNLTFDVTSGKNYAKDTSLLYSVSNNNDIDVPFTFQVYYKDSEDVLQATYKDVIIPAFETTAFYVEPVRDGEYMAVYMRCLSEQVNATNGFNETTCGTGYQVRENTLTKSEVGVDSVFTPMIAGVVDLVEINLSIWKIIYYILIAVIIIGSIVIMVKGAYKFYVWAEEVHLFGNRKSNFKR